MKFTLRYLSAIASLAFVLPSYGENNNETGNGSETVMAQEHQNNPGPVMPQKSQTNMHTRHNSLGNNFAHKGIVILESPYRLNVSAAVEFESVINAYIQLKNALVVDDEKATDTAIELLAESVTAVNSTLLHDEGLEAWQNHRKLYESKLREMLHIKGLGKKRSYFSHISEIMFCMVKSFGLKSGDLFVLYCPMAFDGKGAYWISDNKKIQNPYFGKAMPTCGEIREEL